MDQTLVKKQLFLQIHFNVVNASSSALQHSLSKLLASCKSTWTSTRLHWKFVVSWITKYSLQFDRCLLYPSSSFLKLVTLRKD